MRPGRVLAVGRGRRWRRARRAPRPSRGRRMPSVGDRGRGVVAGRSPSRGIGATIGVNGPRSDQASSSTPSRPGPRRHTARRRPRPPAAWGWNPAHEATESNRGSRNWLPPPLATGTPPPVEVSSFGVANGDVVRGDVVRAAQDVRVDRAVGTLRLADDVPLEPVVVRVVARRDRLDRVVERVVADGDVDASAARARRAHLQVPAVRRVEHQVVLERSRAGGQAGVQVDVVVLVETVRRRTCRGCSCSRSASPPAGSRRRPSRGPRRTSGRPRSRR
jgi:hypothetical protein